MESNLNYEEIETVLHRIMGNEMNFEQLVGEAVQGGRFFSLSSWGKLLGDTVFEQLEFHGRTIGYLFLLIISAAVLAVIARAFRNRQISDMGFYMIFLLFYVILVKSFGVCYDLTESVVGHLTDFMKVLMPAYLMAVSMSSYRTSAVVYYEGFLLLVYYLQKLVEVFLLPAIRCYVLLTLFGHLGTNIFFEKGREGLKKVILWAFKAMIGATAGLQMIQGMISPAIDEMKQSVFNKGISSLGSVGNVAQNVTDVILGSGALIKNGIGAVAAVILVSICLVPAVQTACYAVFYQLLAAVAEPISDKRLTSVLGEMGEGIGLLVKLLFTVCAMFLLTIAIVCVTTGGIR